VRFRRGKITGTVVGKGDKERRVRVLGHTEVSTTMKYLHFVTADVQAPRQRLSILNRLSSRL
jgi:hypothetical protein